MLGMQDYEIMGVDLNVNEFEPVTHPKSQINFYPIKFPVMEL